MATKVSDVLKQKGFAIVTVAPTQTVAAVVEILTQHRIGAAPVTDPSGRLIGIISERDVVRGVSQHGVAALTFPTERLMTHEVKTCSPDDPIITLMEIMTNQRIRHLPVVEGDALRGIISIGDVVKQRLAEAQHELDELRRYISSHS
jgi:CBS domain-containing protein